MAKYNDIIAGLNIANSSPPDGFVQRWPKVTIEFAEPATIAMSEIGVSVGYRVTHYGYLKLMKSKSKQSRKVLVKSVYSFK